METYLKKMRSKDQEPEKRATAFQRLDKPQRTNPEQQDYKTPDR